MTVPTTMEDVQRLILNKIFGRGAPLSTSWGELCNITEGPKEDLLSHTLVMMANKGRIIIKKFDRIKGRVVSINIDQYDTELQVNFTIHPTYEGREVWEMEREEKQQKVGFRR